LRSTSTSSINELRTARVGWFAGLAQSAPDVFETLSVDMLPTAKAAMLLMFDVVADVIPEHDDWHTHEHLPERLSIPGFLRGTRWVSPHAKPRYFVMYEVETLATLQSQAYLDRLDHPSPWTSRMMPSYRGMTRGLCAMTGRSGAGLGPVGLLIRFEPRPGYESALRAWLVDQTLPGLASRRGIGSAHLLERALKAPMTTEQSMRGADAGVAWALFITGYCQESLAPLAQADLGQDQFAAQGGTGVSDALYRMHYTLTAQDVRARPDAR
jgi:hypothetical protein